MYVAEAIGRERCCHLPSLASLAFRQLPAPEEEGCRKPCSAWSFSKALCARLAVQFCTSAGIEQVAKKIPPLCPASTGSATRRNCFFWICVGCRISVQFKDGNCACLGRPICAPSRPSSVTPLPVAFDIRSSVITITIYFINPSGKLKLSFDRTTNNISQ